MEENVLQTAYQLFTTRGINQYTMDDLARQIGISKKTLYRFFPSKLELITQVCNRLSDQYENALQEVTARHLDSLASLLGYISTLHLFIKRTNHAFMIDLRKHYPAQWKSLNQSLRQSLLLRLRPLLEQGIVQGVFRGNLHPELIITIFQQHTEVDMECAAQLVNDYSKEEVFRQAIYLFLYGIVSPQAIPRLEIALTKLATSRVTAGGIPETYIS